MGLIEAVFGRCDLWADGVSYLDMGDAIVRGDWAMAINAYWSPLYPFLQGVALRIVRPTEYSQFSVVYAVNFLIYLFGLGCFDYLLRTAVSERRVVSAVRQDDSWLPDWAVFVIGYAVFLWSSLTLITMQSPTPDILMAGLVYMATALLLRIWARPQNTWPFVLMGVVLALGYFSKAAVFPLAFIFFAVSLLLGGNFRSTLPRVLIGVFVFLAVASPWLIALSRAKGRFTFGDTGRFNYVREVNLATPNPYFQNTGTGAGHLVHPVRKIFDSPPIYEFAVPVKGTLPVWYDPSYWSEGAVPRVTLKRQLGVIHRWMIFYFHMLFPDQVALVLGFIVLCFSVRGAHLLAQVTTLWPVWFIGVVGLGMYAMVFVEPRYVAVFFTLIWVGLFAGLRKPTGRRGNQILLAVTFAIVIATATPTVVSVIRHGDSIVRGQTHNQWQVAQDLEQMGVMPGDRIGRIGGLFNVGWARLLGVRIVADVPRSDWAAFWEATPEVQAQAIGAFRRLGVTAIVAEQTRGNVVNSPGPEWHKLGNGTFYALKLTPEPVRTSSH